MTDEPKLLPCPFCGNKFIQWGSNGWGNSYQKCSDCGATGPSQFGLGGDPKGWNTRADLAHALVAEAYDSAFRAAFRACKTAEAGYIDENSRLAQRIENELRLEVSKAIKKLTPADAIAAREARDAEVWNAALREAAAKAVSLDEFELDTEGNAIGVKSANPQEISDAILALIEKDKTNDG